MQAKCLTSIFTGVLEVDIRRALADEQSASYGMALRRVREEGRQLAAAKRIALEAKKIGTASIQGNLVTLYAYTATGL